MSDVTEQARQLLADEKLWSAMRVYELPEDHTDYDPHGWNRYIGERDFTEHRETMAGLLAEVVRLRAELSEQETRNREVCARCDGAGVFGDGHDIDGIETCGHCKGEGWLAR